MLWMLKTLFLLLLALPVYAEECEVLNAPVVPNQELANTMCLFSKPLIVGASVSAGYGTGTGGPAAILSRSLNPSANVTNLSVNGATSMISTNRRMRETPSVVLGFDMFFWDTARGLCDETYEKNTREFFKRYQDQGVPMIIGKIPVNAPFPLGVRLAGNQPCTSKINRLIRELCTPDKNCLTYDPRECFTAMGSPVSPTGEAYFQDPVHPTTAGNRFCAENFMRRGAYKQLSCRTR